VADFGGPEITGGVRAVGVGGRRTRARYRAAVTGDRVKWVTALALAGALGMVGCGGGGSDEEGRAADDARPDREAPEEVTTTTVAAPAAAGTQIAQATGAKVDIFSGPDGGEPTSTLDSPNENGAPLVFLVEKNRGDWLEVLLPVRPNGSTGWIRTADVTLASTTYSIDIALADHRLVVRDGDDVVIDTPIAVGTASTPTPGGRYYIKELLQPPNPGGAYGPYAYGLSGFSNVLDEFGGGDGVIGIHGTNEPEVIGTDVSHGCIRVANDVITQMASVLPLGTPVHINP
jgi:lipoprotein-anchoring transpeptidase ErfK/SrfK